MFDTCSSLDLIDEDVAKQCPLRKSEKIVFRVAGGRRIVSKMIATITLSLTPSTTITRSVRVVKHLKVADVILGMSFLCHENATINCAEKRVVFPNNKFVQCNDKTRRANCLVLSPTKFAKLLRKSTRYKKGQLAHFWVGVIQPSRRTSIFQNDEIASIYTGLGTLLRSE